MDGSDLGDHCYSSEIFLCIKYCQEPEAAMQFPFLPLRVKLPSQGLLPASQGQNLVLTVVYVPCRLQLGGPLLPFLSIKYCDEPEAARQVQGYLAHKKEPPPIGLP